MKKMNNKGFSMVELIIVIAIMAILAGALAPTLLKYVNKSRMSTDITTASSIATACSAAMADVGAENDAPKYYGCTKDIASIVNASDSFASVVKESLGGKAPTPKYQKNGAKFFIVKFGGTSTADVNVTVYSSTTSNYSNTGSWELSPNPDSSYE